MCMTCVDEHSLGKSKVAVVAARRTTEGAVAAAVDRCQDNNRRWRDVTSMSSSTGDGNLDETTRN